MEKKRKRHRTNKIIKINRTNKSANLLKNQPVNLCKNQFLIHKIKSPLLIALNRAAHFLS